MINNVDLGRLKSTFESVTDAADANLLWEGDDIDQNDGHHQHHDYTDDGGVDDGGTPIPT